MKVIFLDIDGVLNSKAYYKHPDYKRRRRMGQELSKIWKDGGPEIDRVRFEMDVLAVGAEFVDRLNRIVEATGASCVLSSSWRLDRTFGYMQRVLEGRGFVGKLIDRTPLKKELREPCVAPSGEYLMRNGRAFWARGVEIWQWLQDHPEVTSYVILDDDDDFPELHHRHAWSAWLTGIQDEQVELAIKVLGTPAVTDEQSTVCSNIELDSSLLLAKIGQWKEEES